MCSQECWNILGNRDIPLNLCKSNRMWNTEFRTSNYEMKIDLFKCAELNS